ncbi:ORF6C domain-containing protein [Leuconostoc fallax]|uniref:ORF6C domain-containing protein n=1 Tax=Leuconostoc fallax TaxID=1251 RepID=UPI001C1EDE7D|nr:ORF6C domain-containing protein [Leuconostoc fallax]MBU7455870.1 ORF6C domain-containing protein [Leuconostoc fallax]
MNEIKVFEGLKVKEENGQVMFDAETAAIGLGISTVAKSGNAVVRWTRVNQYLGLSNSGQFIKRGDFITEPQFYKLSIKANNETAENFQDWVTSEVLPSVRKTGSYHMKPLSELEQIALIAKGATQLDNRVSELEDFKKDYDENRQIDEEQVIKLEKARKRRAMQLVGGKDTQAYKEFYSIILRNKMYPEFRNKFNVNRYRSLKIKYFDQALKFLELWEPEKETQYAIKYANQMEFNLENEAV